VRAEWRDETKKWHISVQARDGPIFEDECDVFINGGGGNLNYFFLEHLLIAMDICRRFERVEMARYPRIERF
jgi:hypothetical protein